MIEFAYFYSMAHHSALVVVGLSFLLLTLISRLISRAAMRVPKKRAASRFFSNISQAISSRDITQVLAEEVKVLSNKKDKFRLAMLFAVYQPTIDQVKTLSKQSRQTPSSKQTKSLNQQDLQFIREHEKKPTKLINKAFINKFGDMFFMENFIMYDHLCRMGSKVFHIPPNNELRHLFDTFTRSGIAIHGKAIPIADRLTMLNLSELQALADELALNRTLHTVDQAISVLAKLPQVPVRFARRYRSEDLFLLKQEKWDVAAIEQEWSAYNAYAKLLCAESMPVTN